MSFSAANVKHGGRRGQKRNSFLKDVSFWKQILPVYLTSSLIFFETKSFEVKANRMNNTFTPVVSNPKIPAA